MALGTRRLLRLAPASLRSALLGPRLRGLASYTERDGKLAQRQMVDVEARVAAIRKQTETAGDGIETANDELETRPGLHGAEKTWRYIIVGIALAIACSSAYPTLSRARKQQQEREAASLRQPS